MNRFLVIILLFCFQSGYSQNRIVINYINETQVSIGLNNNIELNTKFTVSENGFASKVRLLNSNGEAGDYIVKLLKTSGKNNSLVAGPYFWSLYAKGQGWSEFEFPLAIPVLEGITYTLSISKSSHPGNIIKSSNSIFSYSDTKNHDIPNTQNPVNNLLKQGQFNYVTLVIVYHKLTAGEIGPSQTINFNTQPATLNQYSFPAGGTGTYAYQWQSSNDSINWIDITGANQSKYAPPVLTTSTWYKLNVTSGNFVVESSNSILIKVYPKLIASIIGNSQILCYKIKPASLNMVSLPSGGTGSYIYQWQYSQDSMIWTDILGASLSGYSPPALTTSTWYRLNIKSGYSVNSNTILIKVNPELISGAIGQDQTICYNSAPDSLIQISAPSGGTGIYSFQWQKSSDNLSWTNISEGHNANYLPPSLSEVTWYRRTVASGCTANSNTVKITLYQPVNAAQLYDNRTINENTSTTFKVDVSGGTSPYTINYTVNGVTQPAITNYISGTDLSTGILKAGTYVYSLTSVNDKNGCNAQSLGRNLTETVLSTPTSLTNKALIIVNSASTSYSDYVNYIRPYLDNFGIPYDVCNVNATSLPSFNDYAIIVFGHKNVYSSGYPITALEQAVSDGVGLCSFDPHLFDYMSKFNIPITQRSVSYNMISILNTTHYITKYHAPDSYNSTNNTVSLLNSFTLVQKSNLTGGLDLAVMSSGGQTASLLQITNYGNGKIVKWSGYDWIFESILGPVYGMDDLLWRSIIWAARKPFAMQGMPPIITMRVDDVAGSGPGSTYSFEWVKICNEYGIIPWCGTFNSSIPKAYIPVLKSLIDNNHATASPHAFSTNDYIYFNHDNITNPPFDPAARTRIARDFYLQNGLKISKYFVPHYYEVSSTALSEIYAMGGEFLGIHMLPDNLYYMTGGNSPWLNCGPYRINRYGTDYSARPVYYGGYVNFNGISFFNCVTEIRDDGGYEWYPDNDVVSTSARGIRHLRRAMNSMVLPALFTHERYLEKISLANWREIIRQITSAMNEYNPQYTSIDYAIQYIRAKNNIKITNVTDNPGNIQISYTGNNDLDTKCYLFTENNGQINYRFVVLPQIKGTNQVVVSK